MRSFLGGRSYNWERDRIDLTSYRALEGSLEVNDEFVGDFFLLSHVKNGMMAPCRKKIVYL